MRKFLWILLIAVGCWLGIRFALPILLPFLWAAILVLAAEPLVKNIHNRLHLRRSIASAIGVTITMLLAILVLLSLCALLIRELGSLASILPDLEDSTLAGLDSLELWLLRLTQKTPENIQPILTNGVEGIFSGGSALLDRVTNTLLQLATNLLRSIPDSALGLGTWILASFMLSARLPRIRLWLHNHLPETWHQKYAPHLQTLKKTLLGWLLAQAKLVGVTFSLLAAGFLILRIEHALLWAVATCLVDILPILGTGTVLIPWSIVCFLRSDNLLAFGLLGIYVLVTLVRSVLEPRFVGKQLGLDPLVTLLAIYTGYRLWGLLGMLLAPVLAVITAQILLQTKK